MAKFIGWAAVALIVLWIIHNPAQAAGDVRGFGAFFQDLGIG